VVQESNETLSSSNCTALINSLVLPITYGKGEREGVVRGWEKEREGGKGEKREEEGRDGEGKTRGGEKESQGGGGGRREEMERYERRLGR